MCWGVEYCERYGLLFFEVVVGNNWGLLELFVISVFIGVEGFELYLLCIVLWGMKIIWLGWEVGENSYKWILMIVNGYCFEFDFDGVFGCVGWYSRLV